MGLAQSWHRSLFLHCTKGHEMRSVTLTVSVGVPAHLQTAFLTLFSFAGATLRAVVPTKCCSLLTSALRAGPCPCFPVTAPLVPSTESRVKQMLHK